METAIYGITSFLVSGAAIVLAGHVALTIGNLRPRRLSDREIARIHDALRTDEHREDAGPRFGFPSHSFHGFGNPEA